MIHAIGFNRYIVECKSSRSGSMCFASSDLIDT